MKSLSMSSLSHADALSLVNGVSSINATRFRYPWALYAARSPLPDPCIWASTILTATKVRNVSSKLLAIRSGDHPLKESEGTYIPDAMRRPECRRMRLTDRGLLLLLLLLLTRAWSCRRIRKRILSRPFVPVCRKFMIRL